MLLPNRFFATRAVCSACTMFPPAAPPGGDFYCLLESAYRRPPSIHWCMGWLGIYVHTSLRVGDAIWPGLFIVGTGVVWATKCSCMHCFTTHPAGAHGVSSANNENAKFAPAFISSLPPRPDSLTQRDTRQLAFGDERNDTSLFLSTGQPYGGSFVLSCSKESRFQGFVVGITRTHTGVCVRSTSLTCRSGQFVTGFRFRSHHPSASVRRRRILTREAHLLHRVEFCSSQGAKREKNRLVAKWRLANPLS